MERRQFLKISGLAPLALPLSSGLWAAPQPWHDHFTLPALPYPTNALEPVIDTLTMEIHHGRHHKAYVDNLNKALDEAGVHSHDILDLMKRVSALPVAVRNNGGGHWNHSFFWPLMRPPRENNVPEGALRDALVSVFGSFDSFKEQFKKAALGRFGSGWAWLIKTSDGKLLITSTPNQDNPLMDVAEQRGTPILGIDVWEHAYYLKYQNKRADYIDAWWKVVNWEFAAKNFQG
ncbi:MAG: superoxide dismutase [Flavobacteriales bacterium]|nr:superoxide dismutase [Flavobacteriales bacterium]MCX7649060.1 superoxide dismutase [Flavobacteriales bacterium]MDW8432233.1 superoxide dismutase [Flavobacteriales bacterium]